MVNKIPGRTITFTFVLLIFTVSINEGRSKGSKVAIENSSNICMFGKVVAEMDAEDVKNFLDCVASNFRSNSSGNLPSHQHRTTVNRILVGNVMGTDLISMSAEDLCDIFNMPSDLAHSAIQLISQSQWTRSPYSDHKPQSKAPFSEDIAFEDLARCVH
jgi:hypothetical protein